jgi:hypothetical protein
VPFLAFIYNYLYLHPIYIPIEGARVLEEAWNLLSDNVKVIFRIAESNLDVLNNVDLGPKRPFNVGECALWARLTGLQFAAQVAALVSRASGLGARAAERAWRRRGRHGCGRRGSPRAARV